MFAAFADFWTGWDGPEVASAPEPKRVPAPLLIGDVVTSRGGEPEFLIQWRAAEAAMKRDLDGP